jgi:amino acid adenylation domain-containing protein
VALDFGGECVTYGELETRSNRLAQYLRRLGVSEEMPVGVLLERSAHAAIALLGILKCGGFYVPLDPSYPDERLDFLVRDSGGSLLLTEESLRRRIPSAATRVVFVDLDRERIDRESPMPPAAAHDSASLAYVIYTSGSTGEPKGVAVSHRAIRRLVVEPDYIRLTGSDRVAQASNFSFDAATFEIWGALANGARLSGISKEVALAPADFARELRERGITVLFLTTALFQQIAREAPSTFGCLRVLLFGGEAVAPSSVRAVLESDPRPESVLHVYGPTESTTFASWYPVSSAAELEAAVPIGGPLSGTELYLLDVDGDAAPVGIVGELCIGGAGLARGYLQRADLTAEKFVPHPFSAAPGARLYRTGDRARRRADGNIEFIGRSDHQVKIRGFRVEPSEVAAVLRGHENVRDSVVIPVSDGPESMAAKLVAYAAARRRPVPTAASLRAYLAERVPEFMMPQAFVVLDELPLTPNGKVDRKALPLPERVRPELKAGFAPPRNDRERRVAALWEELLGIEGVGIHDSFFDLGGHSLLMAELHGKLRKRLGIEVAMVKLFQFPTIASLLAHLDGPEAPGDAKVRDRAARQKQALSRRTAEHRFRSKA